MVFGSESDYETMLQIVPTAGFSPSTSGEYGYNYSVDNFDLSFLSGGMETSFATATNNVQQFLSLYYDANLPPPPLLPPYDNMAKESIMESMMKGTATHQMYEDNFTSKSEFSFLDRCNNNTNANNTDGDSWNFKDTNDFPTKQFKRQEDKASLLDMEIAADWECRNGWDNMRVQSSVSSTRSVTSSSNCSSPAFQLCPSTPPDFESIMPLDNIKQEITLNLRNLLAEDKNRKQCQQKKPELLRSILEKSPLNETRTSEKSVAAQTDNHKLLREVLKDTSFQKKYNLRPIDIEGLGTAFQPEPLRSRAEVARNTNTLKEDVCDVNLTEGIIAPMLSKAIEQLMQDVDNTCIMLGIPRDPKKWSTEDVRAWLLWNSRQYNLPIPMELFKVSGVTLTSMTELDLQQRAPQCGHILFAQLEIWKVNSMDDTHADVSNLICDTNTPASSTIEISDADDEEDEAMIDVSPSCSSSMQSVVKMTSRGSGAHIHLWQFLKELLSSPQAHGSCIRWLDRAKGVFKIEDSVRVARLWGKRKNRPAMNYDKLSRSIRQYYKKGIMKKTERSQRLVYQFCTPYNL